MRRLPPWAGVVLAAAASLVLAKPRVDKFSEFHALAQSSSPLKLDDGFFNDIATPPRNYSAAILLTALQPQYNCQLCREVRPEWELLARSWAKGDKKGAARMLFGTLDFANGKETFQRVS
jgi:oligosaccharyltransferase complex subunit gamma